MLQTYHQPRVLKSLQAYCNLNTLVVELTLLQVVSKYTNAVNISPRTYMQHVMYMTC